jgi:hypothetical protein
MNRTLTRLATATVSTALLAATAVATAPVAGAADPTTVCPNGQTGVYLPPGSYPVPLPPAGTTTVGGFWVPLVTVETANGPMTVFLNVPLVEVTDPISALSVNIGAPGIGACATPGTPTVYAGLPLPSTSGGLVPSVLVGTGVLTLVWSDAAFCADNEPNVGFTFVVKVLVHPGHCYATAYVGA